LQGIEKRQQEAQDAENESLRLFSPLLYQLSYPARPPAAHAAKVQNAHCGDSGKHKSADHALF